MLPVRVIGREDIAPGVVSVFIVLPGTRQAPAPYLPGQFVTLALPTSRETLYRSYSLCGAGDPSEPWELTIKRVENGAVSNHFYEKVVPGTLLYASLPRGIFTLPGNLNPEMTLTMVAVGSGVTPIMGMLRAIARMSPRERPAVRLYYASRTLEDIIFLDELRALDERNEGWLVQHHYLSSRGERLSVDMVVGRADTPGLRGHWYMCGPTALTSDLSRQLVAASVKDSHIHAEVFATAPGPAYRLDDESEPSVGGHIQVADTGATLDVEPRETVLAALERHGYRPEYSCRAGVCGACKLRLTQGQASPVGEALSASEKSSGYVLSCIARPMGDITVATGGRPPKGVGRLPGMVTQVASRPPRAVTLLRITAIMGVSGLLVGTWSLTNHRPDSWPPATVSGASTDTPTGSTPGVTTAPGQPTPTTKPGGKPAPTATSKPGGGGGKPAPTATSKPGGGGPAPTATPKPPAPTPTCHSTPSKPC
jgi:ferredoxin-NADP reductase